MIELDALTIGILLFVLGLGIKNTKCIARIEAKLN